MEKQILRRRKLSAYIRGIGDELSQKDVLVTVERIDDNIHQPRNLSLELELLSVASQSPPRDRLCLSVTDH